MSASRKLHLFPGMCRHYSCMPGGKVKCDIGVNIREHVGGPDFGWMARMPCVDTSLNKNPVPCELRDVPGADDIATDVAEMNRRLNVIDDGVCPDCGQKLQIREDKHVKIQFCPEWHVSMRGCKRPSDLEEM